MNLQDVVIFSSAKGPQVGRVSYVGEDMIIAQSEVSCSSIRPNKFVRLTVLIEESVYEELVGLLPEQMAA